EDVKYYMSSAGSNQEKIDSAECVSYALGLMLPEAEFKKSIEELAAGLCVAADADSEYKEHAKAHVYREVAERFGVWDSIVRDRMQGLSIMLFAES
ncbi:MAG: hypothetical protein AB8B77_00865, partial [Alphaproteobacteria bacterium]